MNDRKVDTMKRFKKIAVMVLAAGLSMPAFADGKGKAAQWAYEGAYGPERWAALSPENAKCSQGTRQSPVNIMDREVIVSELESIQFHYQPSAY
ncbi:MAG: hypothetical protein EBX57_01260, partial [Betaproteobacteria bacterium]|nr:hypothetical protein [Betaproteobacteria bacterium]